MTVLHPALAAAAIASVAVPILIHLLFRRRKRVIHWAAMELLARAMRRDRRRQRLERWMLLAARCALLAIAGLAIAQPFVAASIGGTSPTRTLWLVVDDGAASAERLADGGTVLERSTAEARRAVAALRPGDRVGLITASEPVRRVVDPPTADTGRVESYLSTLEPAFTGSDLPQAMREAALAASAEDGGRAEILLLSAFRRGSLDMAVPPPHLEGMLPRGARLFASGPLTTTTDNAWIADVEALRSADDSRGDGERPVRVRVERAGGALGQSNRRVSAGGASSASSVSSVSSAAADLPLVSGERRANVDLRLRTKVATGSEISNAGEPIQVSIDADSQPRDDHRYAILPSDETPRVLVLDRRTFTGAGDLDRLSAGAWMARAIEPGRGERVEVDEVDPGSLDRALLGRAEVVIVARPDLLPPDAWPLLRTFADDGGALVIVPAPIEAGQRWFERFREALAPTWRIDPEVELTDSAWRLAPQQPNSSALRMLGSELSLLGAPVTATRRLRVEAPAVDAETTLLFEDGTPLLLCGRPPSQRGWIALLTTAPELEWTDLPVRPLMVPLMQELVRQGRILAKTAETAFTGTRVVAPRGAATLARRESVTVTEDAGAAGTSSARSASGAGALAIKPDGRTREIVTRPGIYDALDESGRAVGAVAVNVDAKRASIEPNAATAVRAWLQASGSWVTWGDAVESEVIAERRTDSPWSVALLMAAAGIALVEMIVARLLSRSSLGDSAAVGEGAAVGEVAG